MPMCALNVTPDDRPGARVNGVVYDMSEEYFKDLLSRERDYGYVETDVYDFYSDEKIGTAFVFSANRTEGHFDFSSPAQLRYVKICAEAARKFGQEFYGEFMSSTFIDGEPLAAFPELGIGGERGI